jgi:hypothetical protein
MAKKKLAPLTPENAALVERLIPAVNACWQAIGSDVMELCGEDEPYSKEIAIEQCLDANRLAMYGGPDGPELDKLLFTKSVMAQAEQIDAALAARCHV